MLLFMEQKTNNFSQSTTGAMSNPLTERLFMAPTDPIYNEDGSYYGVSGYNPVAINDENWQPL